MPATRVSSVLFLAALSLAALARTPAARAQTILYQFTGNGWLGNDVSAAGDFDGDGVPDLIAGSPNDYLTDCAAGRVLVYSGFDGSVLFTDTGWQGCSGGDWLGRSVAGLGDVNADGFDDVAAGADGSSSEYLRVYAGPTGTLLYTLNKVGFVVSGTGDVDGNGLPDLVAGSSIWNYAEVHEGELGGLLFRFYGDYGGDKLGYAVAGIGDVNGDGRGDVLLGAPFDDDTGTDAGSVRVMSGMDGSMLFRHDGVAAGEEFGRAVGGGGDLDGDGVPDFLVGAPRSPEAGNNAGKAYAFRGSDGTPIHTFLGDRDWDSFGTSVNDAGDVNRDGFDDLVVGAPGTVVFENQAGHARVFSGTDGSVLVDVQGLAIGDQFGMAADRAGDVNQDGVEDLIVGAPFAGGGTATVFANCPGSFAAYGQGLAGSGGLVPQLAGGGCPVRGSTVSIDITNGLGLAPGVLVVGLLPASIPLLGGTLLVQPAVTVPHVLQGSPGVPGSGTFSLLLSIPASPGLVGQSLRFQAFYADPGAPAGVSMTAGLQVTIG